MTKKYIDFLKGDDKKDPETLQEFAGVPGVSPGMPPILGELGFLPFLRMFKVSPKRKRKPGKILTNLKMYLKSKRAKTSKIKIKGHQFDLNLIPDINGNIYSLSDARKDVRLIERNWGKYMKILEENMYNEYYKNWAVPGKKIISVKEWLDGLEPVAVNFYVDGVAEISWADDLIFDGHLIGIELKTQTMEPLRISMNG